MLITVILGTITGNLALGRDTWISSTESGGASHRAVDGNRKKNWGANTCTMTKWQEKPWWAVNLGSELKIGRVEIISRQSYGNFWRKKYRSIC